jgi:hypothetical protein
MEEDPKLSIQLRESTIERIRQVSWGTSDNLTYDQIITRLFDSFYK